MRMEVDESQLIKFANSKKKGDFLVKKFSTPGRQSVKLTRKEAKKMIKKNDFYVEVE